jgi:uncharacterized membrane protein
MKKLKQVIGDGLAITIPLLVILYVFHKAHQVIQVGITPVAEKLGIHELFGKLTLAILAAATLAIIVMMMGLMMRFAIMRSVRRELEALVLRFFPFLNEFKAMMAEKLERDGHEAWRGVALYREEGIQFAFLVEEKDGFGTFILLKGPKVSDGEMLTLTAGSYTYKAVDTTAMIRVVKQFGVGAAELLK